MKQHIVSFIFAVLMVVCFGWLIVNRPTPKSEFIETGALNRYCEGPGLYTDKCVEWRD